MNDLEGNHPCFKVVFKGKPFNLRISPLKISDFWDLIHVSCFIICIVLFFERLLLCPRVIYEPELQESDSPGTVPMWEQSGCRSRSDCCDLKVLSVKVC